LSGLTKKSIYADKVLARILGVSEGDHVSYADISKGLHKYIKENDLRNPKLETPATTLVAATVSSPSNDLNTVVTTVLTKKCRDCEAEIPIEAAFCDLCGVRQ
jgi:ribosomal protein L40E